MVKYLYKVFFLGFLLLLMVILPEILIPHHFISFRSWDSSAFISFCSSGKFYPNQHIVRDEFGDLAHHTKWTIKKKNIVWYSDAIGFRNKRFISQADILILGCSNIAGSGTSQENILSTKVAVKSGYSTYNIAPNNFQDFVDLLDSKTIDKPKIIVYGMIERFIPYFKNVNEVAVLPSKKQQIKEILKKIVPVQIFILIHKIRKRKVKTFLKARLFGIKGDGIQSTEEEKMFFLEGEEAILEPQVGEIENTANMISNYSQFCKDNDIKFIFFPIPNKETTYYDLVPFERQPDYLNQLILVLKLKDVEVINTLKLFNVEKEKRLLYHYDDTHWNKNGIEIISNEITKIATTHIEQLESK